jgi:hypothetical protein
MPSKKRPNRKPRSKLRHKRKQNDFVDRTLARRIHYPAVPDQFHVKLRYTDRTTATSARGTIGLVNYINQLPLYLTPFYQIYNYSRIVAVDMHIEVVNLDTSPYEFIMAVVPYADRGSLTVEQAKQSQNAMVKLVSGSAGMNRAILRKHYNVEEAVGYHLADRDTRMTAYDAVNVSYSDSSLPCIVYFPALLAGTASQGCAISVVCTYHIAWFEHFVPGASINSVEQIVEISEKSFEQLDTGIIQQSASRQLSQLPRSVAQNNLSTFSKPFVKK